MEYNSFDGEKISLSPALKGVEISSLNVLNTSQNTLNHKSSTQENLTNSTTHMASVKSS
ncbi:hypothetical protein DOY81_005529 [Sarcophaga bullata]|nr:hypothetical protein DOY81_005529 [Sarcophaga bullata]